MLPSDSMALSGFILQAQSSHAQAGLWFALRRQYIPSFINQKIDQRIP